MPTAEDATERTVEKLVGDDRREISALLASEATGEAQQRSAEPYRKRPGLEVGGSLAGDELEEIEAARPAAEEIGDDALGLMVERARRRGEAGSGDEVISANRHAAFCRAGAE